MTRTVKNILLSLIFCFCHFITLGQHSTIDSLLLLLKNDNADTSKVNRLNDLSWEYKNIGSYDSALYYGNAALQLATIILNAPQNSKNRIIKQAVQKSIAAAYSSIGVIYRNQSEYPKALESHFRALKINEEIKDKSGIAKNLNNIGLVYADQGDYPKALENYFKVLKTFEELHNKNKIATTAGNIGLVYSHQGQYSKALEYYFKALKVEEELGNQNGIARHLGNIAIVYMHQGDNSRALDYDFKALKINEALEDKNGIAINLGNIGLIYSEQGDYPTSLAYYFKALNIREEIGAKNLIATTLGNIGTVYMKQNKYSQAEKYLLKSIELAKTIGALDLTKQFEKMISKLYFEKGDYKNAYDHHIQYNIAKDSLFNIDKEQDITRKEMNFEFEKKEAATRAETDKQAAVELAERKKEKVIRYSVIAGLILMLIVALVIFRSLRVTRKQKQIIEIKNKETELQKGIIEEKHKEITDSINYAERIQRSFLATKSLLDKNLKDYFVFFQPKDVVSGDFYWANTLHNGNFILATADSTGHGVPGAIMSILNISSLERAIEQNLCNPAEILNHTRKTIIDRLKKDGSPEGGKDGMDCSLICFDFTNQKLTYAAANNPVWIIRENQLLEFKPDKMPVGRHDRDQHSFIQHEFQLQKNDVVYTLTDGLPDQFGGPKGKKFMYKQLKEILVDICNLSMKEQNVILKNKLENWKGDVEQVDDILLIGVRI